MHLIFDFDGTLVNSFQCVVNTFNLLAEEFNFRKIYTHEIEGLRDLTSKEIIKYLRIPIYKIPQVIEQARKLMHNEMVNLIPFDNLTPVLKELHTAGFSLGIVTSNSEENVSPWLKRHEIAYLFDFIQTETRFLGKKRVLKNILKTYEIEKSQALYIGDETRDIVAAKLCEIYSVAVTWGFNSEKALLQSAPHYIARTPQDLLIIPKIVGIKNF